MKFNFDNKDRKLFEHLIDINYINKELSSCYNDFIQNQKLNKLQLEMLDSYDDISKTSYISELFLDSLDFNLDDVNIKKIINKAKLNEITQLKTSDFSFNPYLKNIKFNNFSSFNYSFYNNHYKPYECFIYKDISSSKSNDYVEINHLGYFPNNYYFQELQQNGITWMSLKPHEILTMEKPISLVSDNVITFGLGLGYFSYMVSNKSNVQNIKIIEKSEVLIKLFENTILNQFINKDKISIECIDMYKYLEKSDAFNNYSYAFIDTYHNEEDGIYTYIKFKNIENKYPDTKFIYWIENSLICYLRRMILTLMEEEYYDYEVNYNKSYSVYDEIINSIHHILLNKTFNNYNEIIDFLDDSSLKEFAKQIIVK